MIYDLAPERWKAIPPDYRARMRISRDIRNSIIFFGVGAEPTYGGTGFVQECRGYTWLVTAAHVAKDIGNDPFWLWGRFKEPKYQDGAEWTPHPDKAVDIAVTPFASKSVSHIREGSLLPSYPEEIGYIELGNFVYAVGLFRPLPGKKEFLPVVHTGHIALLPGDERIPVRLSDDSVIEVEGYLIQISAIRGLSGAPVFVRQATSLPINFPDKPQPIACGDIYMLGVFIASYDGTPDPLYEIGKGVDVPVSMGTVIPSHRIFEAVDEHMKKHKKEMDKDRPASKAKSSFPDKAKLDSEVSHKERFNQLLGAAVKPTKSSDQT